MNTRILVALLGMLLFEPWALAERMTLDVSKQDDGSYLIQMGNTTLSAYTTQALRDKLKKIGELKSHIDSLENLRKTQKDTIELQREKLALMEDQVRDLQTEVDTLKKLTGLTPSFSASAGLGYLNNEGMGMLGVGYGDWHLMGLLQPSSAGIMFSKDFHF